MKHAMLLASLLASFTAAASADPLHADVEIDPLAYALDGDSVHVGVGAGRYRLDLGSFAEAMPQFVHGDDGFDVSFAGWGMKAEAFVANEPRGWFAGVDGGVLRVLARRQGTDLAGEQHQVSVGVHAGYRITLPAGFYVTPWLDVGYSFGATDVKLGGATYHADAITIFPAIHLGLRFR